ncbi:MAG: riboflavin biosynthesis protein RibF [Bacilli bacterium]|jgi:riboflavin kinase/FMN adenylyltransferase|nr:riboflavin biosynthesis protein RibF [Bacilli bacterium]HHU23470.1 riboflavin biosynthesis protein RibF [Acholeplasmataceae bacterium]
MVIIRLSKDSSTNPKINIPLIAALGQFDGLHEAHQVLIKKAVALAKERNLKSAVISFDPHPDIILKKQTDPSYLTPLDKKSTFIENLGVDYLLIVEFDEEVARLSHQDFVKSYLLALKVKGIVVGFDYRYGFKGLGNCQTLTSDSDGQIEVTVIDEIKYDNQKMGSTLIRQYLKEGRMEDVSALLGRFYEVEGKVIEGSKIGRKLNLPTANLAIRSDFAPLKSGVYAALVEFMNQKYIGVCNIGYNPTFNTQKERRLEVHILNFEGELYDKTIKVQFVKWLRDEMVFKNLYEFQTQIENDIKLTKSLVAPLLKAKNRI